MPRGLPWSGTLNPPPHPFPSQEPSLSDLPLEERRLLADMSAGGVSAEALLAHPHVQVGWGGGWKLGLSRVGRALCPAWL